LNTLPRKFTRRDRFLSEIDNVALWSKLHQLVKPSYPKVVGAGRSPIGLARMPRVYVAEKCFSFSDAGIGDAIYGSHAIRTSLASTWRGSRRSARLRCSSSVNWNETKDLTREIFNAINVQLAGKGLMMTEATIVASSYTLLFTYPKS